MNPIFKIIGKISPWLFVGILLFELIVFVSYHWKKTKKPSSKIINTLLDYLGNNIPHKAKN